MSVCYLMFSLLNVFQVHRLDLFFLDHRYTVWSIDTDTSKWDVSCIPMHTCWRSLYTLDEFFGWNN
jgi:hypothetical protein